MKITNTSETDERPFALVCDALSAFPDDLVRESVRRAAEGLRAAKRPLLHQDMVSAAAWYCAEATLEARMQERKEETIFPVTGKIDENEPCVYLRRCNRYATMYLSPQEALAAAGMVRRIKECSF